MRIHGKANPGCVGDGREWECCFGGHREQSCDVRQARAPSRRASAREARSIRKVILLGTISKGSRSTRRTVHVTVDGDGLSDLVVKPADAETKDGISVAPENGLG